MQYSDYQDHVQNYSVAKSLRYPWIIILYSNLARLSVTRVENFKMFLGGRSGKIQKSIFRLSVFVKIARLGVEPALTVLSCPPTEGGWSNGSYSIPLYTFTQVENDTFTPRF